MEDLERHSLATHRGATHILCTRRLDLRAPSAECFLEGRDFKVLEINGVTSEASHIYDRKYSLWQAYRVLFEQWRLAFEVGARNRDRGVRPATIGEFLRLLLGSGLPARQ